MKLSTKLGQYGIEVEGANMEECFKEMAEASELLSYGMKCGKSGADDIIMRVRHSGDYEFSEFYCPSSGCSLALGRTKAGGYFAKRKAKDGSWLPNGGWEDWKERKARQDGGKPASPSSPEWEPGADPSGTPF